MGLSVSQTVSPTFSLSHFFYKFVKHLFRMIIIKVVEKAGATIKGTLQRSNPFGVNHCGRMNCTICEGGNSTNCRTRGCVYEYVCGECERKYCGQTGRTIYERNREHMDAWDNGFDECPLQRHSNLFHNGERFDVEVKVVAKCYGRPTRRNGYRSSADWRNPRWSNDEQPQWVELCEPDKNDGEWIDEEILMCLYKGWS